MDRRGFLKLFSMAAAALAVTIPSPAQIIEVAQEQENEEFAHLSTEELEQAIADHYVGVADYIFFQSSPILSYLKGRGSL